MKLAVINICVVLPLWLTAQRGGDGGVVIGRLVDAHSRQPIAKTDTALQVRQYTIPTNPKRNPQVIPDETNTKYWDVGADFKTIFQYIQPALHSELHASNSDRKQRQPIDFLNAQRLELIYKGDTMRVDFVNIIPPNAGGAFGKIDTLWFKKGHYRHDGLIHTTPAAVLDTVAPMNALTFAEVLGALDCDSLYRVAPYLSYGSSSTHYYTIDKSKKAIVITTAKAATNSYAAPIYVFRVDDIAVNYSSEKVGINKDLGQLNKQNHITQLMKALHEYDLFINGNLYTGGLIIAGKSTTGIGQKRPYRQVVKTCTAHWFDDGVKQYSGATNRHIVEPYVMRKTEKIGFEKRFEWLCISIDPAHKATLSQELNKLGIRVQQTYPDEGLYLLALMESLPLLAQRSEIDAYYQKADSLRQKVLSLNGITYAGDVLIYDNDQLLLSSNELFIKWKASTDASTQQRLLQQYNMTLVREMLGGVVVRVADTTAYAVIDIAMELDEYVEYAEPVTHGSAPVDR